MIKRSIIHIGVPKTGTTAIQAALASSRESMIAAGVLFPTAGSFSEEDGSTNHHPLTAAIQGRAHPLSIHVDPDVITADFKTEIAESDAHTLVLSSETLAWELLEREPIERFKRLLPGDDHRVVLYLRAAIDLAERMYMQDLLYNGNTLGPFDWLAANSARLDLAATVRRWVSVFGPAQVLVAAYNPSEDSVASFGRVTGLDLQRQDSRNDRLNRGVHPFLAPLLRELNRCGIASREISLALHDAASMTQPPAGDFRLFTEASLEPLLAIQRQGDGPATMPTALLAMNLITAVPNDYFVRTLLEDVVPREIAVFTRNVIRNVAVDEVRSDAPNRHSALSRSMIRSILDTVAHGMALTDERASLITDRDTLAAHAEALAVERDKLVAERSALVAHAESLTAERDGLLRDRDNWVTHAEALASEVDGLIKERELLVSHADALAGERDGLLRDRAVWATHAQALAAERDDLLAEGRALVAHSRPGEENIPE